LLCASQSGSFFSAGALKPRWSQHQGPRDATQHKQHLTAWAPVRYLTLFLKSSDTQISEHANNITTACTPRCTESLSLAHLSTRPSTAHSRGQVMGAHSGRTQTPRTGDGRTLWAHADAPTTHARRAPPRTTAGAMSLVAKRKPAVQAGCAHNKLGALIPRRTQPGRTPVRLCRRTDRVPSATSLARRSASRLRLWARSGGAKTRATSESGSSSSRPLATARCGGSWGAARGGRPLARLAHPPVMTHTKTHDDPYKNGQREGWRRRRRRRKHNTIGAPTPCA
jgi:hypothetical protein